MGWQSTQFIHTTEEFQKCLLFETQNSQKNIIVEFYIFNFDFFGRTFLQALERAVQRGVYVELLVDALGSANDLALIEEYCKKSGIHFKAFRPPFFKLTSSRSPILNFFKHLNRRNHRKLVIFDQTKALVGSFNLTSLDWRDSAVLVSGDAIKNMLRAHRYAWLRAQRFSWPKAKRLELRKSNKLAHPLLRINSTWRLRLHIYADFLRRIRHAKTQICLVTPYFMPRYRFLKSLEKVAERGVKIQIVLPWISDVKIVQWASLGILHSLSQKGVKIYLYTATILHAKYSIIDRWASLGSHNLNHRSFLHDLELDVIFTDDKHLQNLENQFQIDMTNSVQFDIKQFSKIEVYLGRFLYLFRYWL